jgi:hypothetical protein
VEIKKEKQFFVLAYTDSMRGSFDNSIDEYSIH